ncbi:UNVERIFIED_CONTAM: hypothetical protein Sradi_6434500 [Sesamum radiatum]|uniref:Uncharacterized protein n=1 Tax=Sesamum radiatum TaxID=300843 RepID=A0AAW2K464_SESRA
MSSGSGSLQFVGESVGRGEDAFETTSRGLGPNPSDPESGRTWNLRQTAHRLFQESLGEEGDEWEEGSSQNEGIRSARTRGVPPGTGGVALLSRIGCIVP